MKISEQELPKEWVELVKDAMKSNVSKEKFKKFLKNEKRMGGAIKFKSENDVNDEQMIIVE